MSENNTDPTSEEATRAPMVFSSILNSRGRNPGSAAVSPTPSSSSLAISGESSSVTSSVVLNFNDRASSLRAESGGTSSEPSVSEDTRSSSSTSRQGRFPVDSEGYSHRDALALRRYMSELRINLNRSWTQSQRRRLQRHRRLQADQEDRANRSYLADQASSTASSDEDLNHWYGRMPHPQLVRVPTRGNSMSDCSQCSSETKDEDENPKMTAPNHQDLDEWLA